MNILTGWWGADDGRRKSRGAIQALIGAIFDAATPELRLEPDHDAYMRSYPRLSETYGDLTRRRAWQTEDVIRVIEEMYSRSHGGWMARSEGRLSINRGAAEKMAIALREFDGSSAACRNLVDIASRLANDSMVGGSKFLHFCFPEIFAITDQYLRLVSNTPTPGDWKGQVAYYCTYMAAIDLVAPRHKEIALEWAQKVFGYKVSAIRAVEAFVFYHAREYDHGELPWLQGIMPKAPRQTRAQARQRSRNGQPCWTA